MTIEDMIEKTIGHEGEYSNHPNDTGGETMWGITKRVARANGYNGPMDALPRSEAVRIYRTEYAIKPGFAAIAAVSPAIGAELFDTGVNMHPHHPSLWLQECLNAFNNEGRHYADVVEDGNIGPRTVAALRAFLVRRPHDGEEVMVKALNCKQGARYLDLARARQKNEAFVYGWMRNRVAL
ncbi:glycoside hydrolase family 108 protein [Croceicoccus gelatinilyticus]|uniref:glycoside hydrolase family 108 protein n=1 Tax=Croceicoccus gelatinilyticus TaxID=2835536 RepID=UPI001BCEA406|nr:putative peptidoglycan-binding domain-containing protein [Croceicoccus gelatinilyticus]MBS7669319.1 glycoside hydrolase family 108 protein [Croceicoccus gelatinilyticus]